ncbi:MAG: alpha/beta hydrolase [Lachnospiraceae bacterium]|nr:alpha/beta hydrolase [Lachnospiraceae bacterium]
MLRNRTFRSLMEDPAIAEITPDTISKMDLTREPYYEQTIAQMEDEGGWHSIERGFKALFKAAAAGKYYYSLYSDEECASDPEKIGRNITYFASDDPGANGRPYILVVPGGGFENVWNLTEGWPIADHYNKLGYHVFVLTYRVSVEACAVKAMEDIARAMAIIDKNRDVFRVDPAKYLICGFSAGGYVVCLWNTEKGYEAFNLPKPQACILIYPVTSYRLMEGREFGVWANRDVFAHAGVGCDMEEARNSCFEIPLHVSGFPPTAIFLAREDTLVDPRHSLHLEAALKNAGIPCRLEMGPEGGHGFADGTGMCMEGWPKRAIEWFEGSVCT